MQKKRYQHQNALHDREIKGNRFNMVYNRNARIFLWLILVIGVIGFLLSTVKEKVIAYECNYHFFPRADLAEKYDEFPNLKKHISTETNSQDDLTYLKTCSIVGNTYQNHLSEFMLGFDMYEAEPLNEKWEVLLDTGKIISQPELFNKSQIQFFDICALKYNGVNLFNERLIIQNDSEGIIFGYMRVVYVSSSGKIRSECIPLEGNSVTLDTKKRNFFLKEMCIFSAYEQDVYELQDEVLYRIEKDKDIVGEFILQRINRIEK